LIELGFNGTFSTVRLYRALQQLMHQQYSLFSRKSGVTSAGY